MEIQNTYIVKHKDLEIEYRLIPLDEEIERGEIRAKLLADKELSDKEKIGKVFELLVEDVVSVKGLTQGGRDITIEDFRARKIPAIIYTLISEIYIKHKDELLGNFKKDEAKNV